MYAMAGKEMPCYIWLSIQQISKGLNTTLIKAYLPQKLSSVTALHVLVLSQMLSHPVPSAATGFVTTSVGQREFCREQQDHGLVWGAQ